MGPNQMGVRVTGETTGLILHQIFLCLRVPGPRMFPLACIPLNLGRALIFQNSLFKNILPRQGQTLPPFPFSLSRVWNLKVVEVSNLIKVLEPFENQMKAFD